MVLSGQTDGLAACHWHEQVQGRRVRPRDYTAPSPPLTCYAWNQHFGIFNINCFSTSCHLFIYFLLNLGVSSYEDFSELHWPTSLSSLEAESNLLLHYLRTTEQRTRIILLFLLGTMDTDEQLRKFSNRTKQERVRKSSEWITSFCSSLEPFQQWNKSNPPLRGSLKKC